MRRCPSWSSTYDPPDARSITTVVDVRLDRAGVRLPARSRVAAIRLDARDGTAPMTIRVLPDAAPLAKQEILALLDAMRQRAERDELLALVVVPIERGGGYDVISRGDIRPSSLAGYLGRAWLDAQDLMTKV